MQGIQILDHSKLHAHIKAVLVHNLFSTLITTNNKHNFILQYYSSQKYVIILSSTYFYTLSFPYVLNSQTLTLLNTVAHTHLKRIRNCNIPETLLAFDTIDKQYIKKR